MVAQDAIGFQYEAETTASGMTALGGLPVYLDLIALSGLGSSIKKYVHVSGEQSWLHLQMVLALIFLNISGGECIDALERLENDLGFAEVMGSIERHLLSRQERKSLKARWRKARTRVLPSPSSLREWLERFHDAATMEVQEKGTAIIPGLTEGLRSLWSVNLALIQFLQVHRPQSVATLDMDATLIETHKRQALHCYKGFKAYQPLNCWWAETAGDAAFGVPRRQRAGGLRPSARPQGQPRGGGGAGGGQIGLPSGRFGRLPAGSAAVLWRRQG